ncbi:MAG TPA: nitric oxide reductase transcriptional regulator NorR [Cellvibrio sp.]|nr:nitric oxide reductase transcriptional regulator NorR [Cellvibrio sp.]
MVEVNSTLLIEVALDLANSISSEDRFDRLLTSIRKAINCDAVALLAFGDGLLTPLAIQGLVPDTLGRRFRLADHPRLAAICHSPSPIRFAEDSPHPDPYDGLLLAQPGDLPVHACMGLPLYSDGQLIGLVTLDSLTPGVFDAIPARTLAVISAMSAASLNTAMQLSRLERNARRDQDLLQELTREALTRDGGELIGQSPAMQALLTDINLVAGSDYTVLIEGETGVGKDLVARKLHQLSRRSQQPLVHLNCASLPETLAESELFGHARGAFTGAERDRAGKFQLAHGGTLFLDEVGELPLAIQSKLLRALQSGEIQPVGRDQIETVNVRVLAATNRDLKREVELGNFRADLYHRLSVYPIKVPALRARATDILLLAGYFLEVTARKLGLRQLTLAPLSQNALLAYQWPGNVRELEHMISRAALKAKAQAAGEATILVLTPAHFDLPVAGKNDAIELQNAANSAEIMEFSSTVLSLKAATEAFQRHQITQALNGAQGNWTAAAQALGLDRANLARLAKRLGVRLEKRVH